MYICATSGLWIRPVFRGFGGYPFGAFGGYLFGATHLVATHLVHLVATHLVATHFVIPIWCIWWLPIWCYPFGAIHLVLPIWCYPFGATHLVATHLVLPIWWLPIFVHNCPIFRCIFRKSCHRAIVYVISFHFPLEVTRSIQGNSGGKANVPGGDTIGHCEEK